MEDQVAGPSNESPEKKNPKGKFVGSDQKRIIVNLYKTIKKESPTITYNVMIDKLSRETGIGKRTISNTLSEYKNTGTVTSPNKKKRRLNVLEKTSSADVLAIRKLVHDFWLRKEIPNLKKILKAVNDDENLPSFSETTLNRLLHRMEFKYVVRKHNSAFLDEPHIICWRQRYIEQIEKFRSEGRPIYYLGETWFNAGDCKRRLRVDASVTCPRNVAERGLTTGIPAPMGKGKRLIVAHVGSKDGFVPGALLCFAAKNKKVDYHQEMDGDSFFQWFQEFLPMLADGAVIVMDNASYHSVKMEKYPTLSWKKSDIITWLEGKGETVNPTYVKIRLMDLVAKHKQPTDNYVIDTYANERGCTVLRLPPYHCELNPIELIWAKVKEYIRPRNVSYNLEDVRQLVDAAIANVSPQNWQDCIDHSIKEEQRFLEIDDNADSILEACPDWLNSSDDSDIDVSE